MVYMIDVFLVTLPSLSQNIMAEGTHYIPYINQNKRKRSDASISLTLPVSLVLLL